MILFHNVIIELYSFNVSHFGIFGENERSDLLQLYVNVCDSNVQKFISLLSPDQKKKLALWVFTRSEYNVSEMITKLEKFLKYLKELKGPKYVKKKS
jgi:hypothetical protein